MNINAEKCKLQSTNNITLHVSSVAEILCIKFLQLPVIRRWSFKFFLRMFKPEVITFQYVAILSPVSHMMQWYVKQSAFSIRPSSRKPAVRLRLATTIAINNANQHHQYIRRPTPAFSAAVNACRSPTCDSWPNSVSKQHWGKLYFARMGHQVCIKGVAYGLSARQQRRVKLITRWHGRVRVF